MKRLIINADDFNLTPGVTRGVLKAHDEGILTSTTILINLPLEEKTVREVSKRKRLGIGLHLNVTLGKPLTRSTSLVNTEGTFLRPQNYAQRLPRIGDLIREYETQVQLFQKRFSRKPDHLDTHHHLHDHPLFFKALSLTARKWKLPIRRSRIFQLGEYAGWLKGLQTTDFLFGNLEAHRHWERNSFLGIATNLPEGTSEIGCHPGFCDVQLRTISSFQKAREEELKLFSDKRLRKILSDLKIELIRFIQL